MGYVSKFPRLAATAAAALACAGAVATGAQAAGGSSGAKYSAWDQQWLQTSIAGDRFEILGGRLAEAKGSPAVRALGARLVRDHTKSLADAIAVARQLGISVPAAPEPSQEWELKMVDSLGGPAFDHWYAALEVKDHQQDIKQTGDELKDGSSTDIQKLAADDLPMLREHLKLSLHALAVSPTR